METHDVAVCGCRECSMFRHPSNRVLTEHDLDVLERWAASWPAHPDPRPVEVSRPPAGRVYDDAEQS